MSAAADRAKSIFLHAVEIASADQRRAYLDTACGNEAGLRHEVEELLGHHGGLGSFLEAPAVDAATGGYEPVRASEVVERPGTLIGRYKLLQQIGEGGMGAVWMAEQREPVQRKVALKIIKAGLDSAGVIARFEAERQALALMDHPNIARVLDAGCVGDSEPRPSGSGRAEPLPDGRGSGRPFFVMELVKGEPITKYCDEHRLTPKQRLELFVPICQAIQHAHQKGIIHRDIKPSNVLVAPYDGKPVVKVIDFGVAKATGQRLTEKTLFTEFGAVVGTLEYMSPEQAELNNQDIDTRSDIYSLGVLLYELLTGSTPLSRKRLKEAALMEVLRLIREEEPPKPSTRLSEAKDTLPSVSAQRQMEPVKLTRMVRGELDWIVMKALEKDRNRRYETANGFAMDVQRYLADEPVQACPPSAWYRLRKMARRNKAAMTTIAMFTLALMIAVVALATSTVLTSRAYDAEKVAHRRAEANFQRTRGAVHDFFTTVSQSKLLDVPGVQPVRQELLESAVRYYQALAKERDDDATIQADLALAHLRLAEVHYEVGKTNQAIASLDAGLDLAELLIQNHPDDRELLRRLAGFWNGTRRMTNHTPGPADAAAAERSLSRFIRIWQTLTDKDPDERAFRSDMAATYLRSGMLLDLAERRRDAMAAAQKSAAMWDALVRDYPNEPEYLAEQGDAFAFLRFLARATGQHQLGLEFQRKALEAAEKLAAMNPTAPPYRERFANGIMDQAGALRAQNKPVEAEKQYRAALAIYDKLANDFPTNGRYQRALLVACRSLALLLKSMGQPNEAERFHLRFAEILDKAVDLPAEPDEKSELTEIMRESALMMELDAKSRESLLRQARDINQKLIDRHPNTTLYLLRHASVHANYGQLLRGQPGRQQEAEKLFRLAAAISQKVLSESPANTDYRQYLADRHNELVDHLIATGQQKEAVKVRQWNVGFYQKLTTQFPKDHAYELALSQARGQMHVLLGEWDKAVPDYTRCLELKADLAELWKARGDAHAALGQWDKALADYAKVIELDPAACFGLTQQLKAKGRLQEGEKLLQKLIEQTPKTVDRWISRGRTFRDLGQPDRAIADFSKAMELDPTNAEAWVQRGWSFHNTGQYDKAIADATRAIELNPKHPFPWSQRGWSFHNTGQYDKAIADLTRAIELDPRNDGAWHTRAESHWGLRHYDQSFTDYAKAIELAPGQAWHRKDRAANYKALGQYDKAIVDYSKAIELEPGNIQIRIDRGWAYKGLGQLDKAVADFSKAMELDPTNADPWVQRGWLFNGAGQYDKAIADATRAIELNPKLPFPWFQRGWSFHNTGQYDKAIADLTRAIELDPNMDGAWHTRAESHWGLRHYDQSFADYAKAIELAPGQVWHRHCRAANYKALGQYDKAIADYSKAIDLAPSDHRWPLERALTYAALHQYDKASADYSRAIELEPKNASALNNLAWLLATCPESKFLDPKRAAELARKAVELAPKEGTFWNTLGVAQYRAGNWKAGIEGLNKSRELRKGGDAFDWFFLAMAHWQLGARDEARTWYQKAAEWMDKNAKDHEELRRFRSEAEKLLEIKKK
jgi:tetratricopeptide (TPR) repeat protein